MESLDVKQAAVRLTVLSYAGASNYWEFSFYPNFSE